MLMWIEHGINCSLRELLKLVGSDWHMLVTLGFGQLQTTLSWKFWKHLANYGKIEQILGMNLIDSLKTYHGAFFCFI